MVKVDVKGLCFLLEDKKNLTVVEIGVYKGASSQFLLENYDIKAFWGIDPFRLYDQYKERSIIPHLQANGEDKTYEQYLKVLKPYPQAQCIRDYSDKAVSMFWANSLDFCFIDGNHAYDYTLQDIQLWFPKVKEGGILCGHDIDRETVSNAVDDYFKDIRYDVWKGKKHWFVIKKEVYW